MLESHNNLKRIKTLSYLDGGFWSLMFCCNEGLIGIYFAQSNITSKSLGLLVTVPIFIGAIAQALVPVVFKNYSARKLTLYCILSQIIGIFCMGFSLTKAPFIFPFMSFGLILYWIGGMAALPPWQQLISKLLPQDEFSSFIAKRLSILSILMFSCNMAIACILPSSISNHWMQGSMFLSAFFRILSLVALYFHPESSSIKFESKLPITNLTSFTQDIFCEKKGISLLLICLFAFLFKASVFIASPFFNRYMITELKMDTFHVIYLCSIPILARVFFMQNWNNIFEQKRIYEGLFIVFCCVSLTPILWSLSGEIWYLSIIEAYSGLVWAGYDFITMLLIQRIFASNIMFSMGFFYACSSLGNTLGAFLGGLLQDNNIGYSTIFIFSACLRFCTGMLFLFYFRSRGAFNFRKLTLKRGFITILSPKAPFQFATMSKRLLHAFKSIT